MPDAFTFTAQTGVNISSTVTSNTVTLSGDIGDLWPVVAYGQGAPTIKINGGTATDGRVPAAIARNGDTLTALMTSSGSSLTELIATIQVGGRAVNWSVTTGNATVWDSSNKTSSITLSGGNLVATSGANAIAAVRATTALGATDKKYWELVATTVGAGAGECWFGICDGTFAFSPSDELGFGHSVGVPSNLGRVYINSVNIGNFGIYTTDGDRIGVAVDNSAKKLWWRVNNGAWNNAGGAETPEGGNSSIDYSGAGGPTGSVYPAVNFEVTARVWTAHFASSSWTDTAPTGYSAL